MRPWKCAQRRKREARERQGENERETKGEEEGVRGYEKLKEAD
jgi:hypothetical protein